MAKSVLWKARRQLHQEIGIRIARLDSGGIPNFADRHSKSSVCIAQSLWSKLWPHHQARRAQKPSGSAVSAQTAGSEFQLVIKEFLRHAFGALASVRPGPWEYFVGARVSEFYQYRHLSAYAEMVRSQPQIGVVHGRNYVVTPDVVVARAALSDEEINESGGRGTEQIVDDTCGYRSPLRAASRTRSPWPHADSVDRGSAPVLHASVSCKWTIRSDRAQNTRTEALNLVRLRNGPLPHIVVATMEPLPTRLACVALGLGDIDCVYHVALDELIEACEECENRDQLEMLEVLVTQERLRDVSDLPLDLAI